MKRLNFGCGKDFKEGWDNCDIQKGKGIIYCDMNKYPYPFKDNTYDYILVKQVSGYALERKRFFMELLRIAKHKGIIEVEDTWYHNKGSDFAGHHEGVSDTMFYELEKCRYQISDKQFFKIVSLELIPSRIGRYLPLVLVKKLDILFSGLISQIKVKIEVVKEEQ